MVSISWNNKNIIEIKFFLSIIHLRISKITNIIEYHPWRITQKHIFEPRIHIFTSWKYSVQCAKTNYIKSYQSIFSSVIWSTISIYQVKIIFGQQSQSIMKLFCHIFYISLWVISYKTWTDFAWDIYNNMFIFLKLIDTLF